MGRLRAVLPDVACVLALCTVALAQLWPGLSHGLAPPISWDHGAHLGKAMLTEEELLPFVRGWTDRVELGVPLNTMYGLGGTLWLLCFRFLTFHALDWWQVYAVAVAAFRCVVGLSVFRVARAYGAGRIGALVGGVLALADPGDHSAGGWFYDVDFGVWPMSLAMCLVVLGIAELPRALDGGRAASVRGALFFGAALIAHPFALPATACVLPFLLSGRVLDGVRLRETLARATPVVAVAGLIGAFWFLPFLADRAQLDDHGQFGSSFDELGDWLATARYPLRAGPWEAVLVPVALVFGLASRGRRRWLALAAAAALLVSTRSWLAGTHALRMLPALGRIMYPRFLMIAKPLFFALVGLLAHELVSRAAAELRSGGRVRARIGLAIAMLVVLPVSIGAVKATWESVATRTVTTSDVRADFPDILAYAAYMQRQPRTPFFRVAYLDESSHLFQVAGALTGHGSHQLTPLVAETFGNVSDSRDAAALREMNVRYVVTLGGPGIYGSATHVVRRFGRLTLWEIAGWTPELAWDPSGAHTPHVSWQRRDAVAIDPGGATTVVVRRAFDPGWSAESDGRAVPIARHGVPDSPRLTVMELALPPGTRHVVLRYGAWRAADVLGALCLCLGLVGLVALALPRARIAVLRQRLMSRVVVRRPRTVRRVAFACLALLLGTVLARSWLRYDFVRHTPVVSVRGPSGERTCTTPSDEGGVVCGPANALRVGPTMQGVDGILHDCIAAVPQPGGLTTVVRYPAVPLAGRLHVGGGISDETMAGGRGAPVDVAAFVDGRLVTALSVPNGRRWVESDVPVPGGVHEVRFEVRATDADRRVLCFDAIAD